MKIHLNLGINETKVFTMRSLSFQKQPPDVFYRGEGVFKYFAKFTRKHLCQSLFFNKVAGLRAAILLKNRLWRRCFPVNFAKVLRTPFLQNTSGRLLPSFYPKFKWIDLDEMEIIHLYQLKHRGLKKHCYSSLEMLSRRYFNPLSLLGCQLNQVATSAMLHYHTVYPNKNKM